MSFFGKITLNSALFPFYSYDLCDSCDSYKEIQALKCENARKVSSDPSPLSKIDILQNFSPTPIPNIFNLLSSFWKISIEWKKCKIGLSRLKIGDLAGFRSALPLSNVLRHSKKGSWRGPGIFSEI